MRNPFPIPGDTPIIRLRNYTAAWMRRSRRLCAAERKLLFNPYASDRQLDGIAAAIEAHRLVKPMSLGGN